MLVLAAFQVLLGSWDGLPSYQKTTFGVNLLAIFDNGKYQQRFNAESSLCQSKICSTAEALKT